VRRPIGRAGLKAGRKISLFEAMELVQQSQTETKRYQSLHTVIECHLRRVIASSVNKRKNARIDKVCDHAPTC